MFLSVLFINAVNCWDYAALVIDKSVSIEHLWNYTDMKKPKYSKKNVPQCHFVYANLTG
jgi:hypothetical protein